MAEIEGVQILNHNVIYKLIDEVKALLSEHLTPNVITRVTGEAVIQEIFKIKLKRREQLPIAGSRVRNGMINKTHLVRVLRGDEQIYEGKQAQHNTAHSTNPNIHNRYYLFLEARQEGRHRNAQRHRVRYRIRELVRLPTG
jgi:translation initiation factor IF-2